MYLAYVKLWQDIPKLVTSTMQYLIFALCTGGLPCPEERSIWSQLNSNERELGGR